MLLILDSVVLVLIIGNAGFALYRQKFEVFIGWAVAAIVTVRLLRRG